MPSTILQKYKILEKINNSSKIKTYLTRIEPIVKEIIPKDKDEYDTIYYNLQDLKNDVYEIIEENDKIYIIMENNEKLMAKVDKVILSEKIIKEIGIEGKTAITKEEIMNLFKYEKSMCKIHCEFIKNNKLTEGMGTGFFCELDTFPIKYCLFTNNHVINNIEIGNVIKLDCLEYKNKNFNSRYKKVNKEIKITPDRRVFTNEKLDYTCIELFKSDGIIDCFKIDINLFQNKESLKDNDIFVLQYPKYNDISFSDGKIISIKDNKIRHNAPKDKG